MLVSEYFFSFICFFIVHSINKYCLFVCLLFFGFLLLLLLYNTPSGYLVVEFFFFFFLDTARVLDNILSENTETNTHLKIYLQDRRVNRQMGVEVGVCKIIYFFPCVYPKQQNETNERKSDDKSRK